MRSSTKKRIITIIILVAMLGSSITYAIISAVPSQNEVQANWGARLIIVIFGEQSTIPADIGVTNETRTKLFTLNSDGIMYKTGTEDATLGDFFKIWGENFNSTCILDYCNNGNSSMVMYVFQNGKWIQNSEYENYVIKNGDGIMVDYR